MRTESKAALALLALLVESCGGTPATTPPTDAATIDAPDALAIDAARSDAGPEDAGDDAAIADAATPDAYVVDAGPPDAFVADAGGTGCAACHGTDESAAPPPDTTGGTSTSAPGVGAHATHLRVTPDFRVLVCEDCHVVPTAGDTAHADGVPAELTWSALAQTDAPASYSGGVCAVYCHGRSLPGGRITEPTWTTVDGSARACGACHGVPPPPPHPAARLRDCAMCHPFGGATHVDGTLQVSADCGACHAVPPATGAHRRHFGVVADPPVAEYGDLRVVSDYEPGGSSEYVFGCGNCHPRDASRHRNGSVDVELFDVTAPATSLKARNAPTAAYSGGTCRDVYCHSSGQQTPTFGVSPPWTGTFAGPRCAACHGNPPAYASGGAGTATANGHVVLADDGWEYGHFGGLPGPWHGGEHGARAAPITCQACHYATVDPASVGPGGYYYLDTDGVYDLGGALGYRCSTCHTGAVGAPATRGGAVLTARHVDGRRDVVFDPRTSIPSSVTGLPAGANRPTYPYWVVASPSPRPPSSVQNGTTWSLNLASAGYDAATQTCTAVPCHLQQSFGTGSPLYDPLRWGVVPVGMATCNACHQF